MLRVLRTALAVVVTASVAAAPMVNAATALLRRVMEEIDVVVFADVLAQVCAAVPLEETHAYHIDYPGLQATRGRIVATMDSDLQSDPHDIAVVVPVPIAVRVPVIVPVVVSLECIAQQ